MKTLGEIVHLPADRENGRPRALWSIDGAPHVLQKIKRIFPRFEKKRTGAVVITDTPEVCREITMVLTRFPMQLSKADAERLEERSTEHDELEEKVSNILSGKRIKGLHRPAVEPRQYQLEAADLALGTGRLLLADVVGLGKTFSSLLVLRDPRTLPAVIVTLTHLPNQWLEELNKTLPWLKGHVVTSATPYDPSTRRGMDGQQPDVLICNYAKLVGWADDFAAEAKTVIFDEVQELRREKTLRYVSAAQVADACDWRLGLSATPVYNYGGEIHNILSVLAPDALGDIHEFEREWGKHENGHLAVKDPKALGTFLRDSGLMLRRTRKEVGRELPDIIRIRQAVEADSERLENLSEDALDLARLIVDESADAKEVFKAKGEFDLMIRKETGLAKAPYVADFVRMLVEQGEKVVLFGWHHSVYGLWRNRLRDLKLSFYTGKESATQKEQAVRDFVEGDSQVFVMSLRAGAGLNGLQDVAHVCVFGELDWTPAMHDQCIGRLARDGQDESTVAYFMVCDVGLDPIMEQVLQLKRMQAEPLMDAEAELFEPTSDRGEQIKVLAADFLRKRGQPVAA